MSGSLPENFVQAAGILQSGTSCKTGFTLGNNIGFGPSLAKKDFDCLQNSLVPDSEGAIEANLEVSTRADHWLVRFGMLTLELTCAYII